MRSKWIAVLAIGVALAMGFGALAEEPFKIGINNFGQANFFARIGRQVMINVVEALGGVPISTVTASVPERIAAIENFIAMGVPRGRHQDGRPRPGGGQTAGDHHCLHVRWHRSLRGRGGGNQ